MVSLAGQVILEVILKGTLERSNSNATNVTMQPPLQAV